MEADDLLCSRNARPQKALVGRAQWKINQSPSQRDNERAWKDHYEERWYSTRTVETTQWQPAPGYGLRCDAGSGAGRSRRPGSAQVVLIATPVDLGRISTIKQSIWRVTYRLEEQGTLGFRDVIRAAF